MQSLEDTYKLGEKLAQNLKGGEIIELISDVGGGKTAFVRGMAKGIDSIDEVASPTFTINRIYRAKDSELEIEHYDFYRLNDAGILKAEIAESLENPVSVVVIEWAELISGLLDEDRLRIGIEVGVNETERQFTFTAGSTHQHLMEGLN